MEEESLEEGHLGGLKAEESSGRHLKARSLKIDAPLQRNAKVAFNFQFYDAFLKVRSPSTVNYNRKCSPIASTGW